MADLAKSLSAAWLRSGLFIAILCSALLLIVLVIYLEICFLGITILFA